MKRLDSDDETQARQEIQTNDLAHASILKRLVHADWQDPLLYDLVINSDGIPIDEGVALISHVQQLPSFSKTVESKAHLTSLSIEYQLQAILSTDAMLKGDSASINFEVDPYTHGVTHSGGVRQLATRQRTSAANSALDGVISVFDNIQVVRD